MRKKTRTTNKPSALRWLLIPLSAILLAFIVSNFLVVLAYVPSGSMEPTIAAGGLLLGSRLAYHKEDPQPGDVVFFRHKETGNRLLVKRIVAVGGDTFEIKSGVIYRNDEPLSEPYRSDGDTSYYPRITVPEGMLILLGDNRTASQDARDWEQPFVAEEDVVGKALLLLFPQIKSV